MLNLDAKKPNHSCGDQALASILSYFDVYEYASFVMFADRWGFDFDENSQGLIGDNIFSHSTIPRDLIHEIAGIKRIYKNFETIDDCVNKLVSELAERRPMTCYIDTYHIPWDISYHRSHVSHSIIFVGIDKEGGVIHCSDRYNTSKIEHLPIASLPQACKTYVTYETTKKNDSLNEENCLAIVKDGVRHIIETNIFERIRDFSVYIKDNLDIPRELDAFGSIAETPLIESLNDVGYSREAFSRALEYVKIKYKKYDLDYFIENLELLGSKWRELALVIGKHKIGGMKKFNINKVSSTILSLADPEEKLARELLEYLNDAGSVQISKAAKFDGYDWDSSVVESEGFIQLDVTRFMNNRAFARRVENEEKANYSNSGEFMVLRRALTDHTLKYRNMSFDVKIDDFTCAYDNFVCEEQEIEIPANYYSDIFFITTAQHGSHKSEIMVAYEENTKDYVPFCVSDWRSQCVFGEEIIYEGLSCKIVNELKNMPQGGAYIYLQGIKLPTDRKITKITLPYHPNIAVFATGLRKY